MTSKGAYFATKAQRALLARGRYAYALLRDDPRFTYYGRTVGLASPESGGSTVLASLTRLQGSSNYACVANADLPRHTEAARAQGLSVTCYTRWEGAEAAREAADAIPRDHPLPRDLTTEWIDGDAPHERLAALAEVALPCGVLPPAGAVLRGQACPGLAVIARDRDGTPVACAGAAAYLHADHPLGCEECWWAMLATHPARRGAAAGADPRRDGPARDAGAVWLHAGLHRGRAEECPIGGGVPPNGPCADRHGHAQHRRCHSPARRTDDKVSHAAAGPCQSGGLSAEDVSRTAARVLSQPA